MTMLARRVLVLVLGIVLAAGSYVLVRYRYGAFEDVYHLSVDLPRATQLLRVGTDVRQSGVIVGSVSDISLNGLEVTLELEIEDRYRVPSSTEAFVDLKTLLGDKFVDLRSPRFGAPFLADGDPVPGHVGPEFEDVLQAGVDVLEAVDPTELASIIHELARGSQGRGDDIARGLDANATLSQTFRATLREQLSSWEDFGIIFGELANRIPDLNALADAVNEGVPVYASPEAQRHLHRALIALSPMAEDFADLLILERPAWDRLIDDGDVLLQTFVDHIGGFRDLVTGISSYVFKLHGDPPPVGDGTGMAPFSNFIGGGDEADDLKEAIDAICDSMPPPPPDPPPICEVGP